ncbi:SpaA isopeptide-forming pilin-related protein [Hungatella hathewayi]|uniref:SpaA isopeptide-forming pilin-related protein n=1 Tax=Hungatella hathewayi TaxID=154046 RepID=UPI0035691108
MVNKFRSKLSGLLAGLMVVSSISAATTIQVLADETDAGVLAQTVEVNGFTLEREDEASQWTVVAFDGSTTEAIIPDAVNSDSTVIDNPEKVVPESVMYIKESVFDEMSNVESLKLPKYLKKILKDSDGNSTAETLSKLTSLSSFDSNNEGNMFYVFDGALYAGKKIISYPQQKNGNYKIKEGTTAADELAFMNANISTLTIPDGFVIDNQKVDSNGRDYYRYTFLSAEIDQFDGYNCKEGSLFADNGKRLIAYGKGSNADLSGITSANPYAFQTEEQLVSAKENCNIPESIIKTVPFSFYSGEANGSEFQTRYFNIDGKTAYCYNHGKLNPETVGDLSDYDETISDDETRREVKTILFTGYPNDAYDLLDYTGVDVEAAKNITGALVWEAVDGVGFDMDAIYGIEDIPAAEQYAELFREKIVQVSDSELQDFELKFYTPKGNVQGLVVINKISRPEPTEKPSIIISKQDITTKEELPGASLVVTKEDVVIDEWVSTSEKHEIKDLEDGTYVLTEVTAPDGYEVAESITFTVENGKVPSSEVIMYDAPICENIIISKQDATTKKELPGAKLELYKDGVMIDTFISTTEVHVIASPSDGTYVLKEITAPKGYEIAESITFEVKDGKVSPNPIIMYDHAKVEETKKNHNGGWSGGTDTPLSVNPAKTPITEINNEPTTEIPTGERPQPVTGDIGSIVEIIMLLLVTGGMGTFVLYKFRNKDE